MDELNQILERTNDALKAIIRLSALIYDTNIIDGFIKIRLDNMEGHLNELKLEIEEHLAKLGSIQ